MRLTRFHFILAAVFAVALTSQLILWLGWDYVDEDDWQRNAEILSSGSTPNFDDDVMVHPGTGILVPAAGLISLGVPSNTALNVVISLFVSTCATATAAICMFTRPRSLWWLGAAILFVYNPLYSLATAPGAVAGAIVPFFVILLFYAREQKKIGIPLLAALAATAGVLLATRLDTGLIVCFFTFFYLWYLVGPRVWFFTLIASLTFVLMDPYLWTYPIDHVDSVLSLMTLNVTKLVAETPYYTLRALSLAVVALILGLVASLRPGTLSVPRDFIWYLALMFVCASIVYSLAEYHPVRYYFPFSNALELFLPLFVFEILALTNPNKSRSYLLFLGFVFLAVLLAARTIPVLILAL